VHSNHRIIEFAMGQVTIRSHSLSLKRFFFDESLRLDDAQDAIDIVNFAISTAI
jgi:hypothetical protein